MSPTAYLCDLALVGDEVVEDVVITVDDGRFTSVETAGAPPADPVRLRGLTLPGLANSHSHAFHRALRSRTQVGAGSFWTWRDLMYRAAERLDPDRCHRLARATFAEMALAGIAVVGEFHYVHHQPDGNPYGDANAMAEAVLAAAADAGIRITLLDTLYLHGGFGEGGLVEPVGVQRRFADGSAGEWAERVDALTPSPSQRIGAAIHSARAVDPAAMEVAAEWAAGRDAPLHAHVSEQHVENEQCLAANGTTPTRLLDDAGALSERFTAVHATHVSDDDVSRLARTGSSVCLCPTTERDLGDGIGPSARLADRGVPMTVGSDSHAVIDLFEEVRAVELDQRLRSERRGVHSSSALLAMATVNGHAAIGWSDSGSIAPGNRADLVTLALDSVRTAGMSAASAVEAAVFAATAADVRHVVVDGATVVEDGRHTRVDVAAELDASIRELMAP